MADFVEATGLQEVPAGKGAAREIAGRPVALFNVDGQIYAIDDICPDVGASRGLGTLDGRVKVVDGAILVAVGSAEKAE